MRIEPALIEKLRKSLQGIEQLQQLGVYDLTREGREILKFCVASDAVPEEMGTLACRLLFAAPSSALESVVTQNAEGEWVHTIFVDQGRACGDWFYAVKHADEGEPNELRACLLSAEVEMTDDGRALLNDFVSRYRKVFTPSFQIDSLNHRWDMKARLALARALEGGLKRPRARPATPIYTRSDADARIECTLAELRAWRKVFGRSAGDKKKVAALYGLSESTLENALGGRRGSSRRKAARRKKAMPRR